MTVFFFVIGWIIGMGIGMWVARGWNQEVIENQKQYIKTLCSEGFIHEAKKSKKQKGKDIFDDELKYLNVDKSWN